MQRNSISVSHQTEWPEDWQTLNICQPQLHQTECDNDAVEYVPANLKVVVGIHSNKLEDHFCCENTCKNL